MSGEVAHQETPATKEAARDLDPTRADEPTAAGAALLAGGPRMLSPAYVTSLQRLAGNAGLASVLQPRPVHAPVVARQEAPDTRAAQWSHGWMAGSLKELAALPPAELAKVEAHAKDPDVDAKRFEIMLTAVRLSKAGGGKDWQLRDLYRQMQGASIPQDQQLEVATFVGAFGLFTPKTINEYVKDVGDIFAGWAELGSTDARAEAFGYLINRQLGYQRVPPVKIVVAGIASGGEFNKDDWTVTISTRLGALNLTPEQQSDLIRRAAANFLHEARHAEQIFTVARARAGAGSSAETIAKELKIPGDIAGKAHGLKVPPGSPEAKAAAAWYESEFGAGKAHRDAVLGDLDKRHDEYAALPEEADAHALGVAVSDRIQGGVPAPAGAAGGDGGLPGGVQRQHLGVRAAEPSLPHACGRTPGARRPIVARQVVVQREDAKEKAKATLLARGATLSDEDLVALVGQFPKGEITLSPIQLYLYGKSATSAAAVKVPAIQILGLNYSPKTATYVFETGPGRAILVVGEGGASRLFDAGAVMGRIGAGINFLVQSGLSKTPGIVKISHTDSDHLTDLQAVVDGTGMPKPLVEITKQQLADPGMKPFAQSRLLAIRPQLLQIDVTGEGIHVRREISGALTYTDIRWAPAHGALASGGSKRTTNAGSPVSVVRDLLTGEVRVYTADSEPSTVMKMFDYIHPSAMPYIFGAGQLKEFEIPHHGGSDTETRKTEAGRNYIRLLRLAYEASDGTTTFFVQTKAQAVDDKTNRVRVLHAAGFPVETVLLGKGPAATKIQGGVPSPVQLGPQEQAEITAKVQPSEGALMSARKVGASVGQLRTALQIQLDAAASESPGVSKGIADTLTKLDAEDKARVDAVNAWWTALDASIVASGGFNEKTNVSACNAAIERLKQTAVMSPEKLLEYERTVQFQSEMMTAAGRVAELALGMCDALLKKDVPRAAQLKTLQGAAYRQAVATLGTAQVEQTLREIWKVEAANLQKIQGQLLEMGQAAAKAETENRLAAASMGALANQMRAQEMVNKASEGQAGIPRTSGGAINQRARAGAGAMAALEVIRLTLEIWHNIEKGIAAAKVRAVKRQLRGWNKMQWWQEKGASPQVEVVDDSDNPLSPRLTDLATIYKVLAGDKVEGYDVPDQPRIVITGLTKADQTQAAMNLFLNASNLNEWHKALNDARSQQDEQNRPPIAVDDTGKQWAAYVWDFKKKDYVPQIDAEASTFIDQIYKTCFDNSDAELKQAATSGDGQVMTVKPTGWINKTRDVYVYSQRGGIHKHRFPFEPRLTLPKTLPSGGQVRAKAADATTYDYLRQFLWIVERQGAQTPGTPIRVEYEPNEQGRCYVDVSDLEKAP